MPADFFSFLPAVDFTDVPTKTLIFRYLINLAAAWFILDRLYFKLHGKKEYLFTFYIFNTLIFFIASALADVRMKTGFSFGLFAVFSILRYRTEQIGIKEMTFLFISIIIAVLNSTVTAELPFSQLIFANTVIICMTFLLELRWMKNRSESMDAVFDDVSLLEESKRQELLALLSARIGRKVNDVRINKINWLQDTAEITLFYE